MNDHVRLGSTPSPVHARSATLRVFSSSLRFHLRFAMTELRIYHNGRPTHVDLASAASSGEVVRVYRWLLGRSPGVLVPGFDGSNPAEPLGFTKDFTHVAPSSTIL